MAWQHQSSTLSQGSSVMLEELRTPPGLQRPPSNTAPNPFNNPFYGASSGLIQDGLGEYSERIFGSGTEYVQSNISKGHWTRIAQQLAGGLTYKPPIYDINAPDLYIPFMAFGTYVFLSGLAMGLLGKFSPEALSLQFSKGLLGWLAQVLLLRLSLYALGSGEAPILDTVAYGGYAFAGIALSVLACIVWSYSYYVVMLWTCLCMAVFLVKTMKRVLFAEARRYDRDSSRHHYLLLFMAISQFPLFLWLGHITA